MTLIQTPGIVENFFYYLMTNIIRFMLKVHFFSPAITQIQNFVISHHKYTAV